MHTARMTTDLPAEYWRLHGAAREPAAALTQACIFTAAHLGLLHSARDLHIRTHATLVVALAHSPARRILDALLHALLHAFNTARTAQHDSTTARQHDTNNDRTIERQNDATQSDRITERRTNSTNSTDKWPHKDSQSTRGTPHCPLWSRYAVVLRGSNSWPAAQSDGDWIHCTKTVAQTSVDLGDAASGSRRVGAIFHCKHEEHTKQGTTRAQRLHVQTKKSASLQERR